MKMVSDIFQFILDNLYLRFLLILVITIVVAYSARAILKFILKPLVQKTKTQIDDLIVKSISSIIFYILLVLGLKIGFEKIEIESNVLNSLINSLLIVIVTIFVIRILHNFSQHWLKEWASRTKSTADDRLIPLIEKILRVVVGVLAVIFIFSAWNINISPLLATAGIAGLAVGLAVKDSLSNILGGLQLVLDRTFKVGDKVELESGEMGVILDIGLRSTKLKTYDNEVIYIPNGYLANAKIKNFTMPDLTIRVNVEFGVEYGSDVQQVRDVVLEAMKKVDTVLEEPLPDVLFSKMSDFSLDFVARAWVKSYTEAFSTHLVLTEEIYKALNRANIGIPFPTRTVYIQK